MPSSAGAPWATTTAEFCRGRDCPYRDAPKLVLIFGIVETSFQGLADRSAAARAGARMDPRSQGWQDEYASASPTTLQIR